MIDPKNPYARQELDVNAAVAQARSISGPVAHLSGILDALAAECVQLRRERDQAREEVKALRGDDSKGNPNV